MDQQSSLQKSESDAQREKLARDLWRQGTELLHAGKAPEALPLLQKGHALAPDQFELALNLSGAYILLGQFKQAIPLLERLQEREPGNSMVWINLGAAYLGNPLLAQDDQQFAAIAAFEQALAIDPTAPSVAYNLGLIYRDRQENQTAMAWFRRAVQTNPNDRDARRWFARLEADQGSTPEA